MKILIIDDTPTRYCGFIHDLAAMGIPRADIDLVQSAMDARTHLEAVNYDLAILDLVLPLRPEDRDDPDVRHSLDLLTELHEGQELKRPGHIIGITADRTLIRNASEEFAERTWSILDYAPDNDSWKTRALHCVTYLQSLETRRAAPEPEQHQVDLAIVCALAEPEMAEVLRLPWDWGEARPISDTIFVYDGTITVQGGGRPISVCVTTAPRMGMVSTALHSTGLISLLRPRMLAMCGICAGVRGKADIGDVILADPAWDYQSGKKISDPKKNAKFLIDPHHLTPDHVVRTHVQQLRTDKAMMQEIYSRFGGARPANIPDVRPGPMATGSAVIADSEIVECIKDEQHRKLEAIEMEVYGLYVAASTASRPKPMVFALKAVCDFADPVKNDDFQQYAAYNSANVLKVLMERFGHRLLGP